mgnify:CR=1 FL=1
MGHVHVTDFKFHPKTLHRKVDSSDESEHKASSMDFVMCISNDFHLNLCYFSWVHTLSTASTKKLYLPLKNVDTLI